jgi:hypothetical protein
MSTRHPAANLPPNMEDYRRALEHTLTIAEDAQANSSNVLGSMRQSIASNYGLGSRVPTGAGSLSTKVGTDLQNLSTNPAATVTLQRTWNNLGSAITVTSPAFSSNIALSVAGTAWLDVTGGDPGAVYSHWLRIQLTGGMTGTKVIPRTNFGQIIFTDTSVPASTNITVRMQVWGNIQNPDNSFVNGSISTSTVVRLATSMRAISLV